MAGVRIGKIAGKGRTGLLQVSAGLMATILLASMPAVLCSEEHPQFEVASIKRSSEERLMTVNTTPGGRLSAVAPVKLLIMKAYGLQLSEIAGGPDWINTDRYEVNAKAETNAGRERLMLMLQGLLQDRFLMKSHRETRESAVYALVVYKRGPKLSRSDGGDCPTGEMPRRSQRIEAPPCGQMRIVPSSPRVRMEGSHVPISELVRVLAVALRFPVVDRTHLGGMFDIQLDFIDDASGAPASDSQGPILPIALQEQLGLKLQSTKGPVEFFVIDSIERPTAN